MIDVVLWQENRKKMKAETQFYFKKWTVFTSELKDTLIPFIVPREFVSAPPYLSVPAGMQEKNAAMEMWLNTL